MNTIKHKPESAIKEHGHKIGECFPWEVLEGRGQSKKIKQEIDNARNINQS